MCTMCVPACMHPSVLCHAFIGCVSVHIIYNFACGYAWLTVCAHLHLVCTHVFSLHMCYILTRVDVLHPESYEYVTMLIMVVGGGAVLERGFTACPLS